MEDEDNLEKWKSLKARTVGFFLLTGQQKAAKKTLVVGDAKWKYFEHTGSLITTDGSGDDLLKHDGNPKNESVGPWSSGVGFK